MIVNIHTKEGEVVFETNNIDDIKKRNKAHVIIQKVANLEIVNEALAFAGQAHRTTLEDLLMGCTDAKIDVEKSYQKSAG
jgi:RNase P/RNase MRP subunit p29